MESTMSDDAVSRITELEIRFTHQEKMMDELNGVILSQQKSIENLLNRQTQMDALLEQLTAQAGDNTDIEPPPPHY